MSAQIRQKIDYSTGHGCWPSRSADGGSNDVRTNALRTVRVGDHYASHCCPAPPVTPSSSSRGGKGSQQQHVAPPTPSCHDGFASRGSPNVFANGRAHHRAHDSISCGDIAAHGSPNVFVNGG
jgi:uncharacterized Zn-binding protein involved in type VI secretion